MRQSRVLTKNAALSGQRARPSQEDYAAAAPEFRSPTDMTHAASGWFRMEGAFLFRTLLAALTVFALSGATVVAQETPVPGSSPTAKPSLVRAKCVATPAPGTKSNSATSAAAGTVEGIITWQYNDFVGTKGDVGAKVMLFPENAHISVADFELLQDGIPSTACFHKYHLFTGTADGYGKATIDDLPAGSYHGIVYSAKTTRNISAPFESYAATELRSLIQGDISDEVLNSSPALIRIFKWAVVSDIQVRKGQTTHFNHDFGNTYL